MIQVIHLGLDWETSENLMEVTKIWGGTGRTLNHAAKMEVLISSKSKDIFTLVLISSKSKDIFMKMSSKNLRMKTLKN